MVRKVSGTAIQSGTIQLNKLASDVTDQSNAIYLQANTARNAANSAYGQANSAYGQANTISPALGKQFLVRL
jgi:hypothetical protein